VIHLALAALLTLAAEGAVEAPKNAGSDVPAPPVRHKVDPVYPPEALAQGVSGIVILELIVDQEGRVASAELVRSVPLLDTAAIEAVRQWTFEVTRVDGRPVRVRTVVPLTFARRLPQAPGQPTSESPPSADMPAPPVEVLQMATEPPVALPLPVEAGVSSVLGVTLGEGVPDLSSGGRPVVPPVARIRRAAGTVTVSFSVDAAGTVVVHAVDGPELLTPQADHAVRSWKFSRKTPERVFLVATFTYEGHTASASVVRRQ
jgi:TonB family protein